MTGIILVLASFLASAVEGVEGLTVVLAAGVTRGWRSALAGLAAALVLLVAITAILGPALTRIPIGILRLWVGALLFVFGLQWLRRAILRASGYQATRDEGAIYQKQTAGAQSRAPIKRGGLDAYGFVLSFRGVFLEGLEVIFIVVSFGATTHQVGLAALGAALALLLVTVTGLVVSGPLTRIPENALKYVVGLLLSSFGTFWAAEGAGVTWPVSDASILIILAVYGLVSYGYVLLLRRRHEAQELQHVA